MDYALEFASAAAALNCTALGARGGIRPLAEIEQLIAYRRRSRASRTELWRSSPPTPGSKGSTERPMMIPLRAENPRRTFPIATLVLIALNVAIFIYQVTLPPKAADAIVTTFGVVPARAEAVLKMRRRGG